MSRNIDFSKSVHELISEYPELADIMESLGFAEVKNKIILNSIGRMMTIPKGAKMQNIPMEHIVAVLKEHGFEISDTEYRLSLLKTYLKRLNGGESLESVRKDFVENFSDVDASEIMQIEQEMIHGGTPLQDVQRLCDVHSALFHGQTQEEKINDIEKEVAASKYREQENELVTTAQANIGHATGLRNIDGHPLQTLYTENDVLASLLAENINLVEKVSKVRELSVHYAKKGDLIYPLLKVKYDIFGPSQVMWTVDDEIRNELSKLIRKVEDSDEWRDRATNVLSRANEMIYKESNILFPLCAAKFSEEDWKQIYRDSKDYTSCLGVEPKTWDAAEEPTVALAEYKYNDEIVMPGGHLTLLQLTAMLNSLPLEISFVDSDNINRYFNEGPKMFKRPQMAINRDVFSCHPPKIEPMVRAIISDFRTGKRDQVPVWMEKNGRTVLVIYIAVRDKEGKYIGTLETVQDMESARKHFVRE